METSPPPEQSYRFSPAAGMLAPTDLSSQKHNYPLEGDDHVWSRSGRRLDDRSFTDTREDLYLFSIWGRKARGRCFPRPVGLRATELLTTNSSLI